MKTSTILIVLLFAFTTKPSFSAHASIVVLDSSGNAVQPGVEYYVVSSNWGAGGGGLLLTFDPKQTCPEIVIQSPSDVYQGLSVTFASVNSTDEDILVDTNITVTFVALRTKLCTTSTVWQVVSDETTGKNVVTLGGVEGDTATYFTLTYFTLTNTGALGYKFSHLGNGIGKYVEESSGLIRLAESETTWPWVFVKAESLKGHGKIKQVVNV